MLKKIKPYIPFLLLLIGVAACNKKEYSIKVDGHIYRNCNLVPIENVKIRLYNSAQDAFAEKNVITDSNGYFNIDLKGEGNADLKIEIENIYKGPISNCSLNIIKEDTTSFAIYKLELKERDTVYISVYPTDYYFSYLTEPPVYKIPSSEFNNGKAELKISRSRLLNYSSNSFLALSKLWVNNTLDVYFIWGMGSNNFQESKEKLLTKTFTNSDRIKALDLKKCDNEMIIALY